MILNLDISDLELDIELKKKAENLRLTEEIENKIKYYEYIKRNEPQLEIVISVGNGDGPLT